MSTKKHKRKTVKHSHKNQVTKKPIKQAGLVSTHPRASMFVGALLIITGLFLLLIGMESEAKFGLAMLSMSVGTIIMFFARSALPKKAMKAAK